MEHNSNRIPPLSQRKALELSDDELAPISLNLTHAKIGLMHGRKIMKSKDKPENQYAELKLFF